MGRCGSITSKRLCPKAQRLPVCGLPWVNIGKTIFNLEEVVNNFDIFPSSEIILPGKFRAFDAEIPAAWRENGGLNIRGPSAAS